MSDVLQFIRTYLRDGGQESERDMLAMAADAIERLERERDDYATGKAECWERVMRLDSELTIAKRDAHEAKQDVRDLLALRETNARLERELAQAREAIATLNSDRPLGAIVGIHTAQNAIAEAEAAKRELAQCRADAERYRWLRGEVHGPHVPLAQVTWKMLGIRGCSEWTCFPDGPSLDAAIDAARAREGHK